MALSAILASIVALAAPPQDPVDLAALVQQMKELRAQGAHRELIPVVENVQDRLYEAGLVEDAIKLHMWRMQAHEALLEFDAALSAAADGHDATAVSELPPASTRTFRVEFCIAESRVLARIGRMREATEAATRARDAAGDRPDGLRAQALHRHAHSLLAIGRPLEAVESFRSALDTVPDGSIPAGWLRNGLASALVQLGRFDRAKQELDRVRESFGAATPPRLVLVVDSQRAVVAMLEDDFPTALQLWESVLTRLGDASENRVEAASARAEIAVCLRAVGRVEESVDTARFAVESLERLVDGDHPILAGTIHGLGSALRDLADATGDAEHAQQARAAYERALGMRVRLGLPAASADRIRLGVLIADYFTDDSDAALELLADAIDGLEAQRGAMQHADATLRADYFRRLRNAEFARWDPFENRARLLLKRGDVTAALAEVERGRARSALDLVQRGGVDLFERAREAAAQRGADEVVARLDAARARAENAQAALERARIEKTPDLAGMARATEAAVRERVRVALAAQPVAQPVDIDAIRATLRDGERMLAYLVGTERSLLFVVPPAGQVIETFDLADAKGRPVGAKRIRALVTKVRSAIVAGRVGQDARGDRPSDRPDSKRESPLLARAHELFGILVPQQAWDSIRDATTAYVVPHRSLHLLPFECLVVQRGSNLVKTRFWIDEGPTIAYGPSGSMLAWSAKTRAAQRGRGRDGDVVVLANPKFDPADGLASLPGTEREARAILTAVPDSTRCTILRGAAATEAAIATAAQNARVLHFATHQVPSVDSAWSAGRIVMALGDGTRPDDGYLEVDELLTDWQQRLRNCELVVISSCRSRLGMLSGDEGVFGFPWGFQFAGCPTVLASMWPVSDRATATLMADFYPKLVAGDGASRAAALAAARKRLRVRSPHPFYWAPFVWIGSPY